LFVLINGQARVTDREGKPSPPVPRRFRRWVFGQPRDLRDSRLFHRLSLIPFLAWVGLGADGLSSSAYGPEEAFKALGEHRYLVPLLAALMAATVLLIAAAYRRIIEEFPSGGGGYVVASKLLGPRAGLTSGAALLVDYVLTITISIAAAGDALFSLVGPQYAAAKVPLEFGLILLLTTLNIRGVRESVLTLLPVFLLFLLTHAVIIVVALLGHLPNAVTVARDVKASMGEGVAALGIGGILLVFLRAFSLGGGTYTGIEAVSNGLPIMREPREVTGKRTMTYMAASLAFTASGLLLCYLLWGIESVPGKTLNAVLVDQVASGWPAGTIVIGLFLFSEASLLVVAAQAGFLDGPRVLANMAVDSWVPHRFAALSDRLTTQNGILLMGGAAVAALLYTGGRVGQLVVMYSINVFLTFSLSMFSMLRFWFRHRARRESPRRLALFGSGLLLCSTILGITLYEKFFQGGWITVVITVLVIILCLLVRRHYQRVTIQLDRLYQDLGDLPSRAGQADPIPLPPDTRQQPIAAILVESFGGVGIHTVLNVFRTFPNHFAGIVFVSIGVVDSGEFKGEHSVEELHRRTEHSLRQYAELAARLGIPATFRMGIGTEVVAPAEAVCLEVAREFPRATFFAGQVIFREERWWQRLLHNGTALAIQKRLQWAGRTMVSIPIRVRQTEALNPASDLPASVLP
jgi:amino acid transporter